MYNLNAPTGTNHCYIRYSATSRRHGLVNVFLISICPSEVPMAHHRTTSSAPCGLHTLLQWMHQLRRGQHYGASPEAWKTPVSLLHI